MEAIQNLPPHQQQAFMKEMESMQLKDSLFKTLAKHEIMCVENCADRYIKMTQRVGLRVAEHQAMQQKRAEEAVAAAAK